MTKFNPADLSTLSGYVQNEQPIQMSTVQALAKKLAAWQLEKFKRYIFFSPNQQEVLSRWSTGGYVSAVKFDREQLMQLSKDKKIYVGIEYEYVEIALTSVEAIVYFLLNGETQRIKTN